jgi:hypothetical protein
MPMMTDKTNCFPLAHVLEPLSSNSRINGKTPYMGLCTLDAFLSCQLSMIAAIIIIAGAQG